VHCRGSTTFLGQGAKEPLDAGCVAQQGVLVLLRQGAGGNSQHTQALKGGSGAALGLAPTRRTLLEPLCGETHHSVVQELPVPDNGARLSTGEDSHSRRGGSCREGDPQAEGRRKGARSASRALPRAITVASTASRIIL
jgi:hypothetical protein